MSQLKTNRDLYVAIKNLCLSEQKQVHDDAYTNPLTRAWNFLTGQRKRSRQKFTSRDLEEFLRALWKGAGLFREQTSLSLDDFYQLIASAYTDPAPPFNELWRSPKSPMETPDLAACLAAKMGIKFPALEEEEDEVCRFEDWERFLLQQIVDLREMAEQRILEKDGIWFGVDSPRGRRWYNFTTPDFLKCAMFGSFGGGVAEEDEGRILVPGASIGSSRDSIVVIHEITWEDFQQFLACGQYYE